MSRLQILTLNKLDFNPEVGEEGLTWANGIPDERKTGALYRTLLKQVLQNSNHPHISPRNKSSGPK